MNSKNLKYLSNSIIFLALILATILNLFAHFKINFLVFMLPAVALSFLFKKMAFKRAKIENRALDYLEALEKEINTAKWVGIFLFELAIVLAIFKYS